MDIKNLFIKKDGAQLLGRIPIAFFDVYWIKANGMKRKIHGHGSFLSEKKINRILEKPESFEFDWKVNIEWLVEGLTHFEKLQELESQRPQDLNAIDEWRVDFINWASPSLWYGDVSEVIFLDLFALMSSYLNINNKNFYEGFDGLPTEIQERNLTISCTLSYLSILIGYVDINFLRDSFLTFLYLDFLYSENTWEQREHEIIQKVNFEGTSVLSEEEKNILKNGYLNYTKKAKAMLEENLTYSYVGDYLRWAMEDFQGHGVDLKVKMNEMSDFELLVILLVKGFHYEDCLLEKNIERMINEMVVDSVNLSDRIRRVISSSVQVASERNTNFLKISGL